MTEALYTEPYQALFETLDSAPDWRQRLRSDAWEAFLAQGVPTRRLEAWRWTNLRALQKGAFGLDTRDPSTISVDALPSAPVEACRIVIVNGHLREDLCDLSALPEGLKVRPLEAADGDILSYLPFTEFPMVALNAAFGVAGVVIEAEGPVDQPLFLVNMTDGGDNHAQSHPQILFSLAEDASLSVISQDSGKGTYLNNTLMLAKVRRGAALTHYALQDETGEATHVTTRFIEVGERAAYRSYRLNLGAAASRDEYRVNLAGEEGQVVLNGGQLLRDKQLGDITTFVDHAVPGATAAETFKGVIDDEAHGVFQGKILVARDAQGTDGRMMNKTLLLSDKAEIDTKPELEIYADDVQCAHGATAGEIDAEALFYLRSRGLSEIKARGLLIRAFLAETLSANLEMPEALQDAYMERIDTWMTQTTDLGGAR